MLIIVLGMAGAILYTEFKDCREDIRQKMAMNEGIRASGQITSIDEKRGKYGRIWYVGVQFEFEGLKYVVELKTKEKPVRSVGETVVVFVDRKDPWKSIISI